MPVYPTPRLLVLLILGVFAAIGVGVLAPALWPWVPVLMLALLVFGLLDAVFAPAGDSLVLDLKLPRTIGVGRPRAVPFSLRFTRWRQPAAVELRTATNAVLRDCDYPRTVRRDDRSFHGALTLKSLARGPGRLEALFVRWRGFLGLVYVQTRLRLDAEVLVTPDIEGVEADASNLFSLDNIYGVPNFRVEYIQAEPRAINLGYWRGVAPNNTIFAIESLMDELALKAGKDPVAFRLANLGNTPRLKACVQIAAQKAGWGNALPARHGRGICAQFAFGTYIATVAEVEVGDDGEVRVHKFTSAIDAGRIVNPDGMLAQLQGGLMFGTTAALFGDITVKNGRVQQSNFNNYRIMRMNEAPAVEIHVVSSTEPPGGMGEPGCTAGPPSVVNAIAAATGVRLRSLPIDRSLLARGTA